jgi:hypothetical protein
MEKMFGKSAFLEELAKSFFRIGLLERAARGFGTVVLLRLEIVTVTTPWETI